MDRTNRSCHAGVPAGRNAGTAISLPQRRRGGGSHGKASNGEIAAVHHNRRSDVSTAGTGP
jgi:hypothetical protein